jgi:hypothetical protein
MGFRLFRKEKKRRSISIDELKEMSEREIKEHEERIDEFVNQRATDVREAVSELLLEVESLDIEFLHPRLRSVARNFVSATKQQWLIRATNNSDLFQEVKQKSEKLAVFIAKNYRLLFMVKPPELEGVNNAIKKIFAIVNEYDALKNDKKYVSWKEIRRITEEIENKRDSILECRKRLKELGDSKAEPADEFDETELQNLRTLAEEIKREVEKTESELLRHLAIIRKPLRIYAHMIAEKVQLNTYREFENEKIRKMAEKTSEEIIKGSIRIKESQRLDVLRSLELISTGEILDLIREIDSLKKKLMEVESKIKTLESIKKSYSPERLRQELEREKSNLEKKLEVTEAEIKEKRERLLLILRDLLGEVTIKD